MSQTTHLITSYLSTKKNYLASKPIISQNKSFTCITCTYAGIEIEIYVYNENFIKLKVDKIPYAICDSIKTFRQEFDTVQYLRYS